jgi:hypothetical protein
MESVDLLGRPVKYFELKEFLSFMESSLTGNTSNIGETFFRI